MCQQLNARCLAACALVVMFTVSAARKHAQHVDFSPEARKVIYDYHSKIVGKSLKDMGLNDTSYEFFSQQDKGRMREEVRTFKKAIKSAVEQANSNEFDNATRAALHALLKHFRKENKFFRSVVKRTPVSK